MVAPLLTLLKKDAFTWTEEVTNTFEQLRQAMVTLPVLALSDFSLAFTVEMDASGYGIGAVLPQKGRPIAYFSQALSDRAQLKLVYERELMVVVLSM